MVVVQWITYMHYVYIRHSELINKQLKCTVKIVIQYIVVQCVENERISKFIGSCEW